MTAASPRPARRLLAGVAALAVGVAAFLDVAPNILFGLPPLAAAIGAPKLDLITVAALDRRAAAVASKPANAAPALVAAARHVVARSPLNPAAIWLLANANVADRARLRTGLGLCQAVTRRDLPTQLELMRELGTDGDAKGAIVHLDVAMRVYGESAQEITAGVSNGLANAEFRGLLAAYKTRDWYKAVLRTGMIQGNAAQGIADTVLEHKLGSSDVDMQYLPNLLAKLVDDGAAAKARSVAEALGWRNDVESRRFGVGVQSADPDFAPLTWSLASTGDRNTSLTGAGRVQADFGSDTYGLVMERVMTMPAGRYELIMEALSTVSGAGTSDLEWILACRGDKGWRRAWAQRVSVTTRAQRINLPVTIGADCATQKWTLNGSTSGSQSGASFELSGIDLIRS